MRITDILSIVQYIANGVFFLKKFHLRGFFFMEVISVEGFLIKQAQNRLYFNYLVSIQEIHVRKSNNFAE